jgi:hypothetical protein
VRSGGFTLLAVGRSPCDNRLAGTSNKWARNESFNCDDTCRAGDTRERHPAIAGVHASLPAQRAPGFDDEEA